MGTVVSVSTEAIIQKRVSYKNKNKNKNIANGSTEGTDLFFITPNKTSDRKRTEKCAASDL